MGTTGYFSFLSITVNRVLKIVGRRPDGVSIQNTAGNKKPRNPFSVGNEANYESQ